MAIRGISGNQAHRPTKTTRESLVQQTISKSLMHRPLIRFYSQKSIELQGYRELIHADDTTKVRKITQEYFLTNLPGSFDFLHKTEFSSPELVSLINEVKKIKRLPIHSNPLGQSLDHDDALHFKESNTFINLPYSSKTQAWSDRVALQRLIREHFKKIYQEGDLAIIPGCTDGQIAIEIYGNSLENGVKLHEIVAADYNLPAMELGYITMKSFGLNPNRIKWIQADIAHESFFRWINKQYPLIKGKHQISTLVQPSLREESLLAFLNHCSHLAQLSRISSTIIMPVLLADRDSAWYKKCDWYVKRALEKAITAAEFPLCIWNKTKYGIEFMRRVQGKTTYAPQQYFVDPSHLRTILEETKHEDVSRKIFDTLEKPKDYMQPEDPRRIPPAAGSPEPASRILCIWEAKPKL